MLAPPYMDDTSVIIGTGEVMGVYYPAGGAICRMMNSTKSSLNVRCGVESTSGSIYNLKALKNADIEFAIVQSDWQAHAYDGTSFFKSDEPFDKLRFVFSLHNEAFTLIVRKDSDIKNIDELKGKIVNIGPSTSSVRAIMSTLMQAKGWNTNTFKEVKELKFGDDATALCNKEVDAIVLASGHPNGAVQDVLSTCPTTIIPIDGSDVMDYLQKHDEFAATVIPGGMYVGVPKDVQTFGVKATLVTTTDTSTEIVYHLTKSVFENFDLFKQIHPVFHHLQIKSMITEGATAPMHPGALKYFKEKGYISHK
ncbi:TAXI family TRAP transporter solute-binding subunit [Rickettsiales endosymbiont of Peranema trichophorum]|uniref:TAXI family TRAP transporter solute-binding subunit n=1 Tax=Rickettsiales endosymbiont of Peranema trichophorum TaxID=2486577 RepID=UPI002414372B|nr:TAXI family TRAP transporter solute-binding subunit [Rickettsiales endosymbiont of Peranema trichophorum]